MKSFRRLKSNIVQSKRDSQKISEKEIVTIESVKSPIATYSQPWHTFRHAFPSQIEMKKPKRKEQQIAKQQKIPNKKVIGKYVPIMNQTQQDRTTTNTDLQKVDKEDWRLRSIQKSADICQKTENLEHTTDVIKSKNIIDFLKEFEKLCDQYSPEQSTEKEVIAKLQNIAFNLEKNIKSRQGTATKYAQALIAGMLSVDNQPYSQSRDSIGQSFEEKSLGQKSNVERHARRDNRVSLKQQEEEHSNNKNDINKTFNQENDILDIESSPCPKARGFREFAQWFQNMDNKFVSQNQSEDCASYSNISLSRITQEAESAGESPEEKSCTKNQKAQNKLVQQADKSIICTNEDKMFEASLEYKKILYMLQSVKKSDVFGSPFNARTKGSCSMNTSIASEGIQLTPACPQNLRPNNHERQIDISDEQQLHCKHSEKEYSYSRDPARKEKKKVLTDIIDMLKTKYKRQIKFR